MTAIKGELSELKEKPWRLELALNQKKEELRSLSLKNYPIYIQSHQSNSHVHQQFDEMKQRSDEIAELLPDLTDGCTSLMTHVSDLMTQQQKTQTILKSHAEIVALLELPQLLESCIRSEMFEEAFCLIHFAQEMHSLNPKNFILSNLLQEVIKTCHFLRTTLLKKLKTSLPLSVALHVVGLIRRVDQLTLIESDCGRNQGEYEVSLRREFLSCRNIWLASLVRDIPTYDAYQFLIKIIDVKSTSWFDMITQYTAIFGEENTKERKIDGPLCNWATSCAVDFLKILERTLPRIDDFDSLATVVEQSLFFGGSLGRVGVDFRASISVHFENHLLYLTSSQWNGGLIEFQDSLMTHIASKNYATPIMISSSFITRTDSVGKPEDSCSKFSKDVSIPPKSLMSFPVLAELTNSFLTSFNELRRCAIISLQAPLARCLFEQLLMVVESIENFCKEMNISPAKSSVNSPDASMNDKSSYSRLKVPLATQISYLIQELDSVFIPYIIRCFQEIYVKQPKLESILSQEKLTEKMYCCNLLVENIKTQVV